MNERNRAGHHVDAKDMKKHKLDVFRLSILLNLGNRVFVSDDVLDVINKFITEIKQEDIDLKKLGIHRTKESILALFEETYVTR